MACWAKLRRAAHGKHRFRPCAHSEGNNTAWWATPERAPVLECDRQRDGLPTRLLVVRVGPGARRYGVAEAAVSEIEVAEVAREGEEVVPQPDEVSPACAQRGCLRGIWERAGAGSPSYTLLGFMST
eukprot:726599-Prymnesium_polylepis.3